MNLKVVGISTSPRQNANTDLLLREALAGAKSAGGEVEYIPLRDKTIAGCAECSACSETGQCKVQDDYQQILSKMLRADRLIVATPIFFMSASAQCKALIDRCQCLWAHKYVLKKPPIAPGRDRRAMVIAVGGTKSTRMFQCVRLTMKYFFDVLDMHYAANLFVNRLDAGGAVLKHPTAILQAHHLGKELVLTTTPPPEKPINVELT